MSSNSQYKIGVRISEKGAKATSREIGKVGSSVRRMGKDARRAMASFAGNVGAQALTEITSGAIAGAKEMAKYSGKIETTKIAFESLSGSAVFAASHIRELQQFSTEQALPFESLLVMSQRLQGAGVEGDKVINIIEDIGNVAAATGEISQDRLEGISVALTQVIGKGKLSAEEMEQLAERGVPAWQLLSESIGLSVAETRKLSESGKLTATDLLKAFENNKFGDALKKQSQTGAGAMIALENSVKVTASQALAPLYKEFSQIAVQAAKEVQAQGNDFEAVGRVIGEYIGFGLGKAVAIAAEGAGNIIIRQLTNKLDFVASGGKKGGLLDPITGGLFKGSTTEIAELFNASEKTIRTIDVLFDALSNGTDEAKANLKELNKTAIQNEVTIDGITYAIDQTDFTLKKVTKSAKRLPDTSKLLKASKAEEEAKALAKQYQTIGTTIQNLALQIRFFGDESEVAATKQHLISAGVNNFSRGIAKQAIDYAKYLDNLKEGQKTQDEYNNKLTSARDEMKRLREEADFKLKFTNPTELDEFNNWVNKSTTGLRGLQKEVDLTREKIQIMLVNRGAGVRGIAYESLDQTIAQLRNPKANDEPESKFRKRLEAHLSPFGLTNEKTKEVIDGTVGTIKNLLKFYASYDSVFLENETTKATTRDFNKQLETVLSKDGVQVFASNVNNFGKIIKLWNGYVEEWNQDLKKTKKEDLTKGFSKLDDILNDLRITIGGRGFKTDLEKLNEKLSNPNVTKAIEREAKAIGLTVEKYKELIRKKHRANDLNSTRPRIVGEEKQKGFSDTLIEGLGGTKFQTDAEMMASTMQNLGQVGADSFNQLAGAMGSVVEQWVLYGGASGENAKKAIASALAAASAQSTASGIMETAYGIAALTPWGRAIYGSPVLHFKSAALFGTVAAGTAVGGRAVAGDSFSQGRGGLGSGGVIDQSSSANPQVITASFPGPTQNFGLNNSIDTLSKTVNRLANTMGNMENRIDSMKPGDVLTIGAKQKKGFISDTVQKELKGNSSKATRLGRTVGVN